MFFTKDVLLFVKVSTIHIQLMISVISDLCIVSSFKVNLDKSRVICSKNTNIHVKKYISYLSTVKFASNLKYLGFPLIHGRIKRIDFNFVLDIILSKLADWKLLNKTGKVTSTRVVLTSIIHKAKSWSKSLIHQDSWHCGLENCNGRGVFI
jgi:hypothetical protein